MLKPVVIRVVGLYKDELVRFWEWVCINNKTCFDRGNWSVSMLKPMVIEVVGLYKSSNLWDRSSRY